MNTMLDLVGSFILFGILLLSLLNMNSTVLVSTMETSTALIVQQNLGELFKVIDNDFMKIGFGKDKPRLKVNSCDSINIAWYSDFDDSGTMDSVSYSLGAISELSSTPNPSDRILRRLANGAATDIDFGIVSLSLTYYDSGMTKIAYDTLNTINGVNLVRGIRVRVKVESAYLLNERYQGAFLEKTYFPRNLAL